MKKRWINIITLVLIVILLVVGVLIGFNFSQLGRDFQIRATHEFEGAPRYRYMVIVDGSDSGFVSELKNGLDGAMEDFGIIYELWAFEGEKKEENIIRQMDIGIESDVDGIIIQVFEDEAFSALFTKARLRNIPIITIANELPSLEKVSFITYNRYQMGSRIGHMLNEHLASNYISDGTIALLQTSALVDQDQALAMQEELYHGYEVKTIQVDFEGENILNAEGAARDIINDYSDLRAIICLSSEETLGVVQAIKDMNKINDVTVIGSGDGEEILDYVSRGVIYATIIPDNERIGYEAMLDMTKYKDGLFVSQYRDIFVRFITEKNLAAYLEQQEGRVNEAD